MTKEDLKTPNPEWSHFRDDLGYMGQNYNPTYEDMKALVLCKSFDELPSFWAGLAEELYKAKYS